MTQGCMFRVGADGSLPMAAAPDPRALRRNLTLYPWYVAVMHAYVWAPVFFLYFNSLLTLERVLRLEALYYLSVVALEVPSGYFSDKVGRRASLLVAAAAFIGAHTAFFLADGFGMLAAAQVLLAAGIAFNSGTDTSFHYDSLAAVGETELYDDREASASRAQYLASAGAALAGGAVGMWALRGAYGLALLLAVAQLGIVLAMREPPVHEKHAYPGRGFFGEVRQVLGYLLVPALAWLFLHSIFMNVMIHVPYEFYQPYLALLTNSGEGPSTAPLAAGVVAAVGLFLASIAAGRSIRLRNRIGTGPVLLLADVLVTGIVAAMGFFLHPLVVVLMLVKIVPRGLETAPLRAAVTPRIERGLRATYLSLQSFAGRLVFAGVLLALSYLAGTDAPSDWATLSRVLLASAAGAAALLVLLAATMRPALRERG